MRPGTSPRFAIGLDARSSIPHRRPSPGVRDSDRRWREFRDDVTAFGIISPGDGAHLHRYPDADAARAVLPDGRLPHRSCPPRRAGADHAWPFRPRAGRPRRGARDARDLAHHGGALRRGLRRIERGGGARRGAPRRRGHGPLRAGRPRARLGPDRHRGRRLPDRRLGRLQARGRPTCRPFELVPCDVFITEARFGLPVFRHPPVRDEIARVPRVAALFPELAHLVGVYALGKAQRVMALIRAAGHDALIYLHGRSSRRPRSTRAKTSTSATRRRQRRQRRANLWAGSESPALGDAGFVVAAVPDPVTAFASGWMRVRRGRPGGCRAAARISDHADWDDLCGTIAETGAGRSGSRTARRTRSCIGAGREGSRRGRCICSATAMRRRAARPRRRACLPGRTKPRRAAGPQETVHELHSMDDRGRPRARRGGRRIGRRLDPKVVAFKLPDQIAWVENARAGNRTAVLQGDPTKSGPMPCCSPGCRAI